MEMKAAKPTAPLGWAIALSDDEDMADESELFSGRHQYVCPKEISIREDAGLSDWF